MSVKKHIAMAMTTGLIGMALISGGTVAYFSDELESKAEIQSGTLELGFVDINENILFKIEDIQPGEDFESRFTLRNNGSLNIGEIVLFSKHTILDKNGNEKDNGFGSQILLKELIVDGKEIIKGKDSAMTLNELRKLKNGLLIKEEDIAFPNGDTMDVKVKFQFKKTAKDQNDFQGNKLELDWTFRAMQTNK